MNDLVQNPSKAIPHHMQAMSQRRWLIEVDPGPNLSAGASRRRSQRADLRHHRARRQRSTALVLHNDADAGRHDRLCPDAIRRLFGQATVTVHKRVPLANATALGAFRQMTEFSQIALAVLDKRGICLPGVISADERDVA